MTEEWNQDRIERKYIHAQAEESTTLEYKAADALGKSDGKKKEITKDVSAMANADGGIIIYGVTEQDKYLPGELDPIDRTQFSKEWLEQVINNIRPRINGLTIHPIDIDTEPNDVVYVAEIPKSTTAHQAKDYRYYKRFNFQAVPMEDYEVKDVMNRAITPDAQVEFSSRRISMARQYRLGIVVSNKGIQVINHLKLEFTFPNFDSMYGEQWSGEKKPFGKVVADSDHSIVRIRPEREIYRVIFQSRDVLFPQDTVDLGAYLNLDYWIDADQYTYQQAINLPIEWILYADNMQPKIGHISISDLKQ
jgi:hypothetical protein